MRKLALVLFCSSVAGCGSDTAPDVADIGWSFNYKDYTNTAALDDKRGCDNQPTAASGPAYDAIASVHIKIADPAGQVPGLDKEYDCSLGLGDKRVPVRGIVKQVYALTLEAKSASGAVLYSHTEAAFDVTSLNSTTFPLEVATGELHFFPTFAGSLTCPETVAKMRYSVFKNSGGTTETTPTTSGVAAPACEQGFSGLESSELFIRNIPVVIPAGSYQTYNDYELKLEALDASDNVVYCITNSSRSVRPGNDSITSNESLSPGSSCP